MLYERSQFIDRGVSREPRNLKGVIRGSDSVVLNLVPFDLLHNFEHLYEYDSHQQ
jgi:hypothetical protein